MEGSSGKPEVDDYFLTESAYAECNHIPWEVMSTSVDRKGMYHCSWKDASRSNPRLIRKNISGPRPTAIVEPYGSRLGPEVRYDAHVMGPCRRKCTVRTYRVQVPVPHAPTLIGSTLDHINGVVTPLVRCETDGMWKVDLAQWDYPVIFLSNQLGDIEQLEIRARLRICPH